MNILFSSHRFFPSIGGIETVSRVLAEVFLSLGHQVKLVTQTPAKDMEAFAFPIIRRPSASVLLSLVKWGDVFFHNNISLQTAWPLALVRKPWVVAHHIWISRPDGRIGWRDRLKLGLLRHATNIAISPAIAQRLPVASIVIPDPYDSSVFRLDAGVKRDLDLIYVGRLVSDKGVDLLLDALGKMRNECGLKPRLSVVGSGPEEAGLREQVKRSDLGEQVKFMGARCGRELAALLNQHRVLVVPSRWEEPFGIVALEGIACGCMVVGSSGGGLGEAIGPCGLPFSNGNVQELTQALQKALQDDRIIEKCRAMAPAHLARHQPRVIAQQYLDVFRRACAASRPLP